MKISIRYNAMPSNESQSFEGTQCYYLQDRRLSQARNQHEGALLAAHMMLVPCLASSTTLTKKRTCSSEMSVDFHGTTQQYILKDRIVHSISVLNISVHCFLQKARTNRISETLTMQLKSLQCHDPETGATR
jgi:N-acetylmuramoyl-L-alanine amidase